MRKSTAACIAVLFFGVVFFARAILEYGYGQTCSDLERPLMSADYLAKGLDPYAPEITQSYIHRGLPAASYPLTTFLVLVPFSWAGPRIGGWIFFSLAGAFLMYGVLTRQPLWRLLIFITPSFWRSLDCLQFSPWVTALILVPALAPLAIAKPQTGIPALLFKPGKWAFISSFVLVAVSFMLIPDWPLRWWRTAQNYDGFVPVLSLPFGPLLLLLLFRWRDPAARLLFLYSLFPLRSLYDVLPLFLVPGSPVVMVSVTFLAWVAHFASNALLPYPLHLQLLIVCIYLPLEFFIFRPVLLPWLGKIRDMRKLPARLL